MIELPDVRQTKSFDCGRAAAKCVLAYWEKRLSRSIACTEQDGTHPGTILAVLKSSGLRVLAGEVDLEILRALLALGYPCITLIQRNGEGHYVTVGRVFRSRVYFQDPADGPASLLVDEFVEAWKDVDVFGTHYRQFILCAFP